ncbi:hypothetical protein Pcinc_014782 [Petrolisthes cinctipes]|uniref:Uncharacterized protein n=1 Tax=Petrolisthes cinctipes TaxID=88211 RepID=A0AAE1KR31_PETCI|nr:hypothetical protein Pcinc_014782 [Petrolisthes cinctipes]
MKYRGAAHSSSSLSPSWKHLPAPTTSSLFTAVSKVFIAPLRCPLRESTYQHLPPRHFSPLLVKHGRHHYRDSS